MTTTWTPEQQKEHRKLWVEALRSGKYAQAQKILRNDAGAMCCLGVACEISGLGRWGDDGFYYVEGHESAWDDDEALPVPVKDWLGLSSRQGKVRGGYSLSRRNDLGAQFTALADIIESEPPGLADV